MRAIDNTNCTDESVANTRARDLNRQYLLVKKRVGMLALALTVGLAMTPGIVQAEGAIPKTSGSALENTERNVRDSGDATFTPEDQMENPGDRGITASIRQAVVEDKSLSVNAQNAKIITRNGVVTLRGPVENVKEKIKLEAIAEKTPGVTQVDNQLEPKAP